MIKHGLLYQRNRATHFVAVSLLDANRRHEAFILPRDGVCPDYTDKVTGKCVTMIEVTLPNGSRWAVTASVYESVLLYLNRFGCSTGLMRRGSTIVQA